MQPRWRCLSPGLGYGRDQGDERRRSETCGRNESFLLINQVRKTSNAIVLMGSCAEFTRMYNEEYLPGQE